MMSRFTGDAVVIVTITSGDRHHCLTAAGAAGGIGGEAGSVFWRLRRLDSNRGSLAESSKDVPHPAQGGIGRGGLGARTTPEPVASPLRRLEAYRGVTATPSRCVRPAALRPGRPDDRLPRSVPSRARQVTTRLVRPRLALRHRRPDQAIVAFDRHVALARCAASGNTMPAAQSVAARVAATPADADGAKTRLREGSWPKVPSRTYRSQIHWI